MLGRFGSTITLFAASHETKLHGYADKYRNDGDTAEHAYDFEAGDHIAGDTPR